MRKVYFYMLITVIWFLGAAVWFNSDKSLHILPAVIYTITGCMYAFLTFLEYNLLKERSKRG